MSSSLITIQITQNVIDAFGSEETEITPEKIVTKSCQSYDENSDYIFEIKEDIIIPTGKTLKDFKNIVVNPGYHIDNSGTINNCTITFNGIKNNNVMILSFINNGYQYYDDNNDEWIKCEGNINDCNITLNIYSFIYNGNGGVGNINGCFITLNGDSEFYNDSYILNNCIFINGSAKLCNFYNYKDNEGNIITTKYGTLKDNYIFADDTSIIQNSYDNTPGVFNNTYLRFSGSSNIDITEYQSLPADSFTLGKTIMSYLNKQFSELKKTITDENNKNSLASQINTLNINYIDLTEATTDKNNKDSLASQISKLEKNTVGVNYTDEHSLFSKINNLTKTTTDKNNNNSLASQISVLRTRVGGLESTTNSLEVNEIALQIEGLSKDIEELVKRIQMLFYNLPNDMSEQLVNKSSDSIQKLLLLLLLNKSDNDLTSNIKRLLKQ